VLIYLNVICFVFLYQRTLIIPQMFPKSGSDEDDSQPSSATSTTSVSPKGGMQ